MICREMDRVPKDRYLLRAPAELVALSICSADIKPTRHYQSRAFMIRPLLLAITFLLAMAPAVDAHRIKTKTLEIDHPWVGDMADAKPPFDLAVQMVIRNTGKTADVLTGATSPHAERIELRNAGAGPHTSVEIKPGARVELSTKGIYLRVVGFKKVIDNYDYFPLTLNFKQAGAVKIEVMVEDVAVDLPKLN